MPEPYVPTLDDVVAAYIRLRDQKGTEKKIYEDRIAAIDHSLDQLETYLLSTLQQSGVESIRTQSGTAYINNRVTYSVKDWAATREFIVQNELWDLLEARVSKDGVDYYAEQTNTLPPGVNRNVFTKIGVRRE